MATAINELLEAAFAAGQEDCTIDVPNGKWGGHVWHFDFRTGSQTRFDQNGAVMATKRIRRCRAMQLVGPAEAAGSGADPPPPDRRLRQRLAGSGAPNEAAGSGVPAAPDEAIGAAPDEAMAPAGAAGSTARR